MLEISKVFKKYEGKPLLTGVSFSVVKGETVCLLGPSGSGKSTLLRIIAGLEQAEQGRILWDGEDIDEVPVFQRHFGLMFQDYALFPHKTVRENVAFGLKMQKLPGEVIEGRTMQALEQVNLTALAGRRVTDLSGGEQQRVAFARVLAPQPRLLMLDEPLGALDRSMREQLLKDLRQMLHSLNIPAIYVTHDQEEALFLADRLLILSDGAIIQEGSPEEVYQKPASEWVARFLGMNNFVAGTVQATNPVIVSTDIGNFTIHDISGKIHEQERVKLLFSSNCASVSHKTLSQNRIKGIVKDCIFNVTHYRWYIEASNQTELSFELPNRAQIGADYCMEISPQGIRCLKG